MRVNNKTHSGHRKRHGVHQKRTKHFLKVYTPYLPLTIFVSLSLFLSSIPTKSSNTSKLKDRAVLAYATEMSISGLFSATNQQRSANGIASYSINSKLNSAAQAKANDMVNRDYWAHNTPDGQAPWVFITNAGYSYSRAGENLAYGYSSSSTTVDGWMGSQSHKDNLLNSNYTEVGFGIANAPNYTGDPTKGPPAPQTVVVAMYATPYSVSNNTTNTTPKITQTPPANIKTNPTPPPASTPVSSSVSEPKQEEPKNTIVSTLNTDNTPSSSGVIESKSVNRLDILTNNKLPWLGSFLIIFSVIGGFIVLTKHGLAFQRLILQGERYVLKHTLFDLTIISMIVFSVIASKTVGVIL